MIIRDAGDSWQIVFQSDHADLSGAFARAWAEKGHRHDSLVVAAERHDDGWAVWEQAPQVDDSGKLLWKGEVLHSDPPRLLSYTFDVIGGGETTFSAIGAALGPAPERSRGQK